jgi:hypothetical protein
VDERDVVSKERVVTDELWFSLRKFFSSMLGPLKRRDKGTDFRLMIALTVLDKPGYLIGPQMLLINESCCFVYLSI